MARRGDLIWAIAYLVFGLYFVNLAMAFYELPIKLDEFQKWITLVGGVLILVGGFQHLRASKLLKKLNSK